MLSSLQNEQGQAAGGQQSTLAQKTAMVAALSLSIAMPVIVFLRKKPGYRFLNPIGILVMFLLLCVLSGLSSASGNPGTVAVIAIFAGAFLLTALMKKWRSWKDIKNGVSWHSYSRGVSWLSFVLPYSDTAIKRWCDPLAVLVVGILFAFVFLWFGLYLILAAFCLFLFSAWDYEVALNAMLDMLDAQLDAEVTSANVEYYGSSEHPQQRPLEETAGIPTGIAPDIEAQIQRRKARKALSPGGTVSVASTLSADTLVVAANTHQRAAANDNLIAIPSNTANGSQPEATL